MYKITVTLTQKYTVSGGLNPFVNSDDIIVQGIVATC